MKKSDLANIRNRSTNRDRKINDEKESVKVKFIAFCDSFQGHTEKVPESKNSKSQPP